MLKLSNKITGLRALWPFDNRWQLVFSRIFFPHESLLTYRKGDLAFLVDHAAGDHNGTRLCLITDIYTRFLPAMNLGETISVFDLGANGGGFPLLLHACGKKFSRLVCVEMNPNTFRRLQYNITRNIPGEVSLVNAAACDRNRTLKLRFGRGSISDTIYQEPDYTAEEFAVAGRTFDDLFRSQFGEETVDICKMDIEGAEYEVLFSAERACLQRCRYLLIELHPAGAEEQERFSETLDGLGFVRAAAGDDRFPGERLYRNTALT